MGLSRRSLLKGLAALPALLVVPWRARAKPAPVYFAMDWGATRMDETAIVEIQVADSPDLWGTTRSDELCGFGRGTMPPLKHADVVKAAKEIQGLNRERGPTMTWKLNERAYREIFG